MNPNNKFFSIRCSCGVFYHDRHWQNYLAVIVTFLTLTATSHAAVIGVNLGDTNFGSLSASDSAGVVPQINWMNVGATSATNLPLTDNTGASTTAQLSYTGALNPIISAASVAGADEQLNHSYLASFSSSMTFSVTNVPYSVYDLIAYVATIQTGRTYSTTVGSTTLYGLSPNPTGAGYIDGLATPYTYTSAVGTTAGTATPNGNYFRFNGLTGSTLNFTMASTNDLPTLTAFQIVAVPEPGSMAMLGLGAAGFLFAVWKRQRG